MSNPQLNLANLPITVHKPVEMFANRLSELSGGKHFGSRLFWTRYLTSV